jgi:hypothetical protein
MGLQLQMDTKGLNATELHSSFFHGRRRIAQSVNSVSSIGVVFCIVVHGVSGQSSEECHIAISP